MRAKIKHIRIELEDGTIIEHSGGRFNESYNYRTLPNSARITSEWLEYVASWYVVMEKPIPVEVVKAVEVLDADELKKNPLFAGIADNRAYYKSLPVNWEAILQEWSKESSD